MNNPESIFDNPMFSNTNMNTVNIFTGNDMTVDTLFLNPGQSSNYSSSDNGDTCLMFFQGQGKCTLKNNTESEVKVINGSVIYIPKGVSYKIENLDQPMIAVKSSSSHHN